MRRPLVTAGVLVLLHAIAAVTPIFAADWPTQLHDNRRSGATAEQLAAARLGLAWKWQSPEPPIPAWSGPARWDSYAGIRNLPSMRNYDPVFHVTSAGGRAYFGSSVDDSVRCLDLKTGRVLWHFTTDGPVRLAPTIADKRVYFGSDDGHAYCLHADTGQLAWKFTPATSHPEAAELVLNNGRLIPVAPCRTGVMVDAGTAYFGCAMLPWHKAWLCAVDAVSGKPTGPGRFVKELSGNTLEAPPAISQKLLIFPQGRVAPQVFRRTDGKNLGTLKKSGGGSVVVVSLDARIFHGPAADTRKGAFKSTGKGAAQSSGTGKTLEMVAGYGRGNALVVAGRRSYMLTDDELIASDLPTRKTLWSVPCDLNLALIAAGDVLFAGGIDRVGAFSTKDGKPLWSVPIDGRVFGLAVADGTLLVSTDTGVVAAYRTGVSSPKPPADRPRVADAPKPAVPLAPVPAHRDPELLARYVFQRPHIEGRRANNLATRRTATLAGRFRIVQDGPHESLVLDGGGRVQLGEVGPESKAKNSPPVPAQHLTASAWVRVDKPHAWGGIVGAIQDNGSYERGWILGFNDRRFSIAIAGQGGPDKLTYLKAPTDFSPRQWHHVAGTYDGKTITLYVNGQPVARSQEQSGPIKYPPTAFFEIGAYHDKDEDFPLDGRIHEVRVYRRALSAAEVSREFEALADRFPTAVPATEAWKPLAGPWFEFTRPGEAVVRWETRQAVASRVEIEAGGKARIVENAKPVTSHRLTLSGLAHRRIHLVTLIDGQKDNERRSAEHELDSYFNHAPAPWPASGTPQAALARDIISRSGIDRGLCLVLGLDDGRLAEALAAHGRLGVIAVDTDSRKVDSIRARLVASGHYGRRVTVRHISSWDNPGLPGQWANLVVSESLQVTGQLPCSAQQVHAQLRPDGGVAMIGQGPKASDQLSTDRLKTWLGSLTSQAKISGQGGRFATWTRGPLKGSAEWSHLYGRADNAAYAGEQLAGVKSSADLAVQWVGRPGPRYQPDRNGRKPSPLSTAGRLFLQGLHRVIAVDAFNGSILWSLEIPDLERFNMPRDCGNWCADRDFVYLAIRDRLWQVDARNGRIVKQWQVPQPEGRKGPWDWGFVARTEDRIIGTAVRRATSWTNYWGGSGAGWYDARSGEVTHKVCSDGLFSIDRKTGEVTWHYSNGVVLNTTLAINGDKVYFVENRHEAVIGAPERRIGRPELWKKLFLVAMDANSGSMLWERPLELPPGKVVFSMAQSGDQLVIAGSADGKFNVHSFQAANGESGWTRSFGWPGGKGDHGKAMSRPAIVGNKVYLRPKVLSLKDGTDAGPQMPGGGCGTYACSAGALFFRSSTVTVWNRDSGKSSTWQRLRPDCWLSTIPASGMLLSPEGGGGCSCGTWMETSVGFIPRTLKQPR